jgi:NAD(P)-dependent dehydrogenase (short-subunit alcohol dehydrogenase family)
VKKRSNLRCDVSKEEEVKSVFSKAKEDLGGVDVCVNNAGVLYITQPLLSQTTEEWRECTDVNIIGLMIVAREFVKQMEERKCDDGHIIIMNSVSGHRTTARPAFAFYTATKYAVTALTEGRWVGLPEEFSSLSEYGRMEGDVRGECCRSDDCD